MLALSLRTEFALFLDSCGAISVAAVHHLEGLLSGLSCQTYGGQALGFDCLSLHMYEQPNGISDPREIPQFQARESQYFYWTETEVLSTWITFATPHVFSH